MSSESLHEPADVLSDATKDLHRAIVSLKEELEAVDWYEQRAEACTNDELRAVLTHNKNEEIEHAMMNLEWIRRHQAVFAQHAETYLKTAAPILGLEKAATGGSAASATSSDGSLGIGSLKRSA